MVWSVVSIEKHESSEAGNLLLPRRGILYSFPFPTTRRSFSYRTGFSPGEAQEENRKEKGNGIYEGWGWEKERIRFGVPGYRLQKGLNSKKCVYMYLFAHFIFFALTHL
jgi:hypothetical protein